MKKQSFRSIALLSVAAVGLTACNPLGNMTKRAEEVTYSVTPSPLEMHADSIDLTISGAIPPRFFNKKVSVEITPTLKYDGGEKTFKNIVLVGEDSEIEGQKINFEKGGNFSYNDKIPYVEGMDVAELMVSAVGKYKTKSKEFEGRKVADGTVITPKLVKNEDMPIIGADQFKKVVPKSNESVINYLVNRSEVRGSEKSDDDIKAMKEFMAMTENPKFQLRSVDVVAYASPEGEISLNENLADNRAASASRYVRGEMRRLKSEAAKSDDNFNNVGKGEDWEGFKSKMEASEIADKNTILRVLEMYDDRTKREQEIKNLAETYEEVKEQILPQLRRSVITVNAELMSFPDEEIKAYAKSNPDTLSAEELLYAATMTEDLAEKAAIYGTYSKLFPEDWRGPNNVGMVMFMEGKTDEAKAEFDKANSLSPNNPVISNNLGIIEHARGNDEKAMEYYAAAQGAGPAVGANMGHLQIEMADYSGAVAGFGSTKSFNAALAQTLNKDYQDALQTIDASDAASSAHGYYLKAVIGARMKDANMMTNNLKQATAKDASLKEKAKKDAEFIDYRDNAEFQAATN